MSGWRDFCAPLLDFLFPPRCPACGAYVEKKGGWCAPCLASAVRVRRLPLDDAQRGALSEAWALGLYHGPLRALLLPLKFKNRRDGLDALKTFLDAAGEKLPQAGRGQELVVPVPLFTAKEKARGGNQTEMIFRDWLTARGWTWRRALVRTRETEPQFGLPAPQRMENIRGAFAPADDISREEMAGKTILLVDDIFTTGATLAECARTLKAAGAAEVRALALSSDRV